MAEETKQRDLYDHYDPSLAAAVIFIILFFGSTFVHILQAWRARSLFMLPFIIGGFCKRLLILFVAIATA